MSYTALYRKLRPQSFADVVGQEAIIRTLINQITLNRVSHAYLFCGTRGTGKTTTAKLFARAVNCEKPLNGEPCNVCTSCADILAGRSLNAIEIDAASNNGVDNIRDIREEVKYPPTDGLYKVYIIDEVHMLSAGAFNALLKTLEEPPAHVIFILATTDPQKIPATIHSRCQRFDFKRIPLDIMTSAIRSYSDAEGISADDSALKYISSVSDGSMRDALSVLDQCSAFYTNEHITLDKVLTLLGASDKSVFFAMADAILESDAAACLSIVDDLIQNGRDILQFVTEFTSHLRNLLVVKITPGAAGLDTSPENLDRLSKQAAAVEAPVLIHYINTFSEVLGQLRYAANPRLVLEVLCIRLCSPSASESYEAIFARLNKLEHAFAEGVSVKREAPARQKPAEEEKKPPKPKALPDSFKRLEEDWLEFIERFDPMAREMMKLAIIGSLDNGILYLVFNDSASADYMKKNKAQLVAGELEAEYDVQFDIQFVSREEFVRMHQAKYGAPGPEIDGLDEVYQFFNLDGEN